MAEKPPEVWGFTLFADDIRAELGGKHSLMGIYQADMLLPEGPPFRIARLALLIMIYIRPDSAPEPLQVRIFMPGQNDKPALELNTENFGNFTNQKDRLEPLGIEPDQNLIGHLRIPLVLDPTVIPTEGSIKVRIAKGQNVYNFGSLKLRKMTEDERKALHLPEPPTPSKH